MGLDKTSSVAYNSGETQLIYFYFSVEIDSSEISASVWQEEGNFDVLKRCYIQIYTTSFYRGMEKLLIFNTCEI